MRESLKEFCLRTNRHDLLEQWDYEKNGEHTPANISYGSNIKVWWRCEKGHSWECELDTRSSSQNGCPVCGGKSVWPGENDLSTIHPEVAAEWHPTKNGALRPNQIVAGSQKKVWWLCANGHDWQARISSRVAGTGCPVCANRIVVPGENDLATTHPELALQWHPTKNRSLTPQDVVIQSHKRVWWRCEKGHTWCAAVYHRATGSGCPVCAGRTVVPGENDLASKCPEIAAQWNQERNFPLTPNQVAPASNKKVWWQCEKGHEWQAQVSDRTIQKHNCPFCTGRRVLKGFNDLQTVEPLIAAQWHPTLNGDFTPDMVTCGSRKRAWWQCSDGHVWNAIIATRGCRKYGCPVCSGKGKPRTPV